MGPAPHIQAELARLEDLARKTRPKSRGAARLMKWPAPGAALSAWRKEHGVRENPVWGAAYDAAQPLPRRQGVQFFLMTF